ncbi:hypothetical protein [Pseudomonas koreensis]|uniref:Uncharacterized protein n=1 Tax=Pseudomonas koreensis TaxID=198620 RepID=A0AA94END6_9PSED|nr:hypothetical protein [Pseudomonas koreensis]RVD77078.1 hypothetical protein A9HBioS_3101 [Pseudomonas koreensis]
MSEKVREQFEVWATEQAIAHKYEHMQHLLKRHPETGQYNTTWVDSAWMGWQASREWLVIELPSPAVSGGNCIRYHAIRDCLEAAGLKVANQ